MAEGKWHAICRIVQRKRVYKPGQVESGGLRRCLGWLDLTALGVGSTLGIGVYVLVGAVAQKIAGPSVLLSFLLAAVVALLAALCYAEFGARTPLAGTAYVYTYVSVGELVAFFVGWNNILEFMFGSASVARGLSLFIDTLTNHSIIEWYQQAVPMTMPLLSTYFDLFAFFFVIAMGILLAFGVRESSLVNNVFTVINILVILFAIFVGAFKADTSNWSLAIEEVPEGYGVGGFFPYGVWGTLKGATVCFYGFSGFDIVNASGEEVKNPQRTIPTAILAVLLIMFIAFMGVSVVVTMMVPYYEMNTMASVTMAFSYVGWEWARWIVVFGAVIGISTCLLGAIFPLPRLLYSMASDGLFIHWFGNLSSKKQSPVIATIIPAVIIGLLSAILDLEQLVLMLCIGTLSSYTIVAICVVLLRYRSDYVPKTKASFMGQIFRCGDRKPTYKTKQVINVAMTTYVCLCIAIAVVLIHTSRPLVAISILHVLAVITVGIIALQPTVHEDLAFKTPLVPFLPCLSIYANIHLLVIINWHTWVRILIWMLIGIPIYLLCVCCYKQSTAYKHDDNIEIITTNVKKNGKPITVQIVVEAPTPPDTVTRLNNNDEQNNINTISTETSPKTDVNKIEAIMTQQMQIENNEEKEAKIIDLLDQVLQAEEDSYSEIISLKDSKEENVGEDKDGNEVSIPHRKSLSELSDAESEASLTNQVLSKYDVIAQVHREDLPKVNEEDEKSAYFDDNNDNDDEEITAFNESETNSRTDESGYSDTIDRPTLAESVDDSDVPNIPVPPPFDENYFKNTPVFVSLPKKFSTVASRHSNPDINIDDDEVIVPRISVESNASQGKEDNIRFGSSRQIKFMTKLNDIFQKTINNEEEEPRKRSQSTGNAVEAQMAVASRERPQMFLDLKKELLSRDSLPNLRPVDPANEEKQVESNPVEKEEEEEDKSMSREDLKNKLENIFSVGGPQLLAKPRLMKSNPSTPEDSYQTDHSSTESIPKLPKIEKNDTLKRQKERFGQVLNSFRLSINKDDEV